MVGKNTVMFVGDEIASEFQNKPLISTMMVQ